VKEKKASKLRYQDIHKRIQSDLKTLAAIRLSLYSVTLSLVCSGVNFYIIWFRPKITNML